MSAEHPTRPELSAAGLPAPEDRCIACTSCTVVCPVAAASSEFLGPRMMGPAHQRFRIAGFEEDKALHYCSNCKNCDISCPCGVPVSTFIMKARAEEARRNRPPLRDWVLAHGDVAGRLPLPAFLKNLGQTRFVRRLLDSFGIAAEAPLPAFAVKTFRRSFAVLKQPVGLPRKAVLFPGCYVDLYDPAAGLDLVRVLNAAGYEVLVPEEFRCCGLPQVANGFWEDARENADRNLNILRRKELEGVPVISGCTSCSLMFKEEYRQYFPDLAAEGLPPLGDACEFVLGLIDAGEFVLPKDAVRPVNRAVYHSSCHLRAQGMGLPGLELLRRVAESTGMEAVHADAGCCGISGSYGFKKEKYAISMRTGASLFAAVKAAKANIAVSECGTCRLQLTHGTGLKAMHPISVLARALE